MAKTSFYEGRIYRDDKTEIVNVDMAALPYELFDDEHPLFIASDVVMEKNKKKPLPDFSNVIVTGSFDCSSYIVTPKSVLPTGIKELKCLYSIKSLADLKGILPVSVRKVIIRNALLNSIIDSVKRNEKGPLEVARQFVKDNPTVTVISDKNVLLVDVLKQVTAEKATVSTKQTKKESVKPTVETKTDDWLSNEELIQIYKESSNVSGDLTDEDIERAIRISKSQKSYLNLEKRELMRADGAIISCVHRNEVPRILNFIQEYFKRDTTKAKKDFITGSERKTEQVTKQQVAPKYYFVGDKEVQETVIKKYIKNSVWKAVCNHCKNDIDKKIAFLQAIESINVRPVDTAGKKVCFIEDNSLKLSPTVTFKNAQWLSQGFGTLDDRARIIWCMNEHGFIATEYFEEHEKKQSVDYKKAIREKNVGVFTPDDTVFVSDLIKELTAEREAKQAVAATESEKIAAQVAEPVKSVVAEPVVEKTVTPVNVRTRQRIRREAVPTKTTTANPHTNKIKRQVQVLECAEQPLAEQKKESKSENVAVVAEQTAKDVPNDIVWTDFDSLHASFTVKIQEFNAAQSDLMAKLNAETNTDVALEYVQQLHGILFNKKRHEIVLNRLNTMKQELQKIKQDFSKQM